MDLDGDRIPAETALAYGIINRIVSEELLMEETMKFAKRLAKQPPLALRLIKDSVNKAVDYSLYEGMQYERKNFLSTVFFPRSKRRNAGVYRKKKSRISKGNKEVAMMYETIQYKVQNGVATITIYLVLIN